MFYFPVAPRLVAHYRSPVLAPLMQHHKKNRSEDRVMRIPVDSMAWKELEEEHKILREDPRVVRLGLAMDGMNPFSNNSTSHSTWPILLVNYNLPPWMAIQKRHIILSAIIPGLYYFHFIFSSLLE
jgi:hypothetical protein